MKFKIPFISKNAYIDCLKNDLGLIIVEDYTISSNGKVATFNIQTKDERKIKKLNKDYPLFLVNQLSRMQDQTKQIVKLNKEIDGYYKRIGTAFDEVEEERRLRGEAEISEQLATTILKSERVLSILRLTNIIKEGQNTWKGKVGQKFGAFILSKF